MTYIEGLRYALGHTEENHEKHKSGPYATRTGLFGKTQDTAQENSSVSESLIKCNSELSHLE
jgi:hypothetical protein